MTFNKNTLWLALASAWAFPMSAAAFDLDLGEAVERDMERYNELTQVQSWAEVGAIYVSDDAFKFGEYTGLEESGMYPLVNFDIREREAFDSQSSRYWILRGTDVGLASRSLFAEQGEQGRYKVWLDYSQLPQMRSDVTRTVFDGAGGTALTLPSGGSLGTLTANLRGVDLEQERQRLGVGGEMLFAPRWLARVSFAQEAKDGVKSTGINTSPTWMIPQSVLVPEPVDHVTNKMTASVAYTGEKAQAEVGYHLSLFENRSRSYSVQDPYAADWGTAPVQHIGLAPDNEFHQVRLAGGYNFSQTTRFYADGAVGRMFQDEIFLPTTATVSRNRLGGSIDTTVANVGMTSRPTDKLNLTASHRYDDRDNNSRGIVVQLEDVVDPLTNRNYSYTEDRTKLAASYRLLPRTNVSLGFERRDIDRTLVARERSTEHTWEGRLRSAFGRTAYGGLLYATSNRDGSTYTGSALLPEQLRQFWLADRDREKIGAFASITPVDVLTLGMKVEQISDSYNASQLGLTNGDAIHYSIDASITPIAGLSLYTFYNYEDNESKQAGATWRATLEDEVGSAGVGARTKLLGDKLDLSADFVYSKGVGRVQVDTDKFPDNATLLRQFNVSAGYRMSKALSLRLRYRLERFNSNDWALDGVDPDTVAGLISMGEDSPDYEVHMIAASVVYRF